MNTDDRTIQFASQVDFSDLEAPNSHYSAVAILRLLLQRDLNPDFYGRFVYLMDHNEDRREDLEMWEKYQQCFNAFLR